MTLKKRIWLNIRWTFSYKAVFMREPSPAATMMYVRIGRMVGDHKCPVCHCKYWVIGNPKVKGHFSPICGKRKCYLTYYGGETDVARVTKKLPSAKVRLVRPVIVKASIITPKRSLQAEKIRRAGGIARGYK